MSLDNVIAIAAAAKGHPELFIFGLLLSIPLIIYGSQLIMTVIERFPIVVWFGAALLGWIAGEMILGDVAVLQWLQGVMPNWVVPVDKAINPLGLGPAAFPHYAAALIGALIVIALGLLQKKKVA
jgi:predicted tellurium resistance membrane protein TerC